MIDPHKVRLDFPILARQIHGKPLVYLDNSATSQKPRQVIQAIVNYYENHNANVHRGVHFLGDESTLAFHRSREVIAKFFGAQAEELVIVKNTTEAINQVAYTWGESNVHANDVILISELEHHSNLVPWQELCKRKQARLIYIPVTNSGEIDTNFLEKFDFTQNIVKLVAISHVSNALGSLTPVSTIIEILKKRSPQTKVLVDGAQAATHMPINFDTLAADFYVVSAHKMLGPMGIGGLFVRKSLLKMLPPFLFGGGMIDEVTFENATYTEDLEERFTAGTPDVAGLVGWAAACEYETNLNMDCVLDYDRELVGYALEQLANVTELQIVGPTDPRKRVGSVAFIYRGVHAHDVGQVLNSEGIAVRSGHHCTMPLHLKFDWQATLRASFQVYNSKEDIDTLIKGLSKVKKVFSQ